MFGCEGHAEKDRASGKWLCLPTIANALAYSAGIDQELEFPSVLKFQAAAEFRRRLPHTSFTVRRIRSDAPVVRSSESAVPLSVEDARAIASQVGSADQGLLTDALLLASALAPAQEPQVRTREELGIAPPLVAQELTDLLGTRYTR